jgi:hypothetical protein
VRHHLLADIDDGIVISDHAEAATYVDDGDHRYEVLVARGQLGGVAVVHNHLRELSAHWKCCMGSSPSCVARSPGLVKVPK